MSESTRRTAKRATSAPALVSRFYLHVSSADGADMSLLRLPRSILEEMGWRAGVTLRASAITTGDRAGNKVILSIEEA